MRIILFTLCMVMSLFLSGQQYNRIITKVKDPNYKHIRVYSQAGYSGSVISISTVNQVYDLTNIGSVKVFGSWKLVNVAQPSIQITEDKPNYVGSASGGWKLEESDIVHKAIVYPSPDFQGLPTFLAEGSYDFGDNPMQSIKTTSLVGAKLNNSNCVSGEVPTVTSEINTLEVRSSLQKCASANKRNN